MRQLIQNFKTGELKLDEVPVSTASDGFLLVNNVYSLISAGTERDTVETAKISLFGKARKRPDLIKQVFSNMKKEGVFATLEKVKTRLSMPKALGYSCSGYVVESRDFDKRFKIGDRVACAGQDYASHAEVVSVPQNLAVKIPDNVSFEEAAFTTIGAIALQGVRQADPKIGEKVCVIGLGLIGQVTFQILKANGCSVCGIDISDFTIEKARKLNIDKAVNRTDENLHRILDEFTNGRGFDKVVITASTRDNDPVLLAIEILRRKGAVIVVGDVKMDIPREPHFYKKELELKIATSYGPGRYDPLYEEGGMDYPYFYVRFTENRNMSSFLELVSEGKVNLKPLITHIFDFNDSLKAYDIVLGKEKVPSIGVLLKYSKQEKHFASSVSVNTSLIKDINIGFIGAGNFAQSYILPQLKKYNLSLDTVVTKKGIRAKNAGEKFGFNRASTEVDEVFTDKKINTVFIATHHNMHASFALKALDENKNVFLEKPMAINIDELKKMAKAYKGKSVFTVGFNRRFSHAASFVRENIPEYGMPLVLNFRINAGYIPKESWIQNKDIGGGRIIGEVCHFVDLMIYFSNSMPKSVYAVSLDTKNEKWQSSDNIAAILEFENGSITNLTYAANGDSAMEKERLEILAEGSSFLIDDFKKAVVFMSNRARSIKVSGKGHNEEIAAFIEAIREKGRNPIDFKSLLYTSLTTFKIVESLRSGKREEINIDELY
jgi:polar amino acid transport system substrate-binding protein